MSVPPRTSLRISSPSGVPPGSRVATTDRPSAASEARKSSAWVVLPEPSSPSKVTTTGAVVCAVLRALVTGGAGFIGSHVADALLARGDEVHILDSLATGSLEKVPAGAELHEG